MVTVTNEMVGIYQVNLQQGAKVLLGPHCFLEMARPENSNFRLKNLSCDKYQYMIEGIELRQKHGSRY